MTAPTPNSALAYRVLDHIDAHPETWNQGVYIAKAECGTAACFAGWTVLLSGLEPGWTYVWLSTSGDTTSKLADGRMVPEVAEELLGASRWLDEGLETERDLFDQFNTREQLGELVAEIFGPRPDAGEGGSAVTS